MEGKPGSLLSSELLDLLELLDSQSLLLQLQLLSCQGRVDCIDQAGSRGGKCWRFQLKLLVLTINHLPLNFLLIPRLSKPEERRETSRSFYVEIFTKICYHIVQSIIISWQINHYQQLLPHLHFTTKLGTNTSVWVVGCSSFCIFKNVLTASYLFHRTDVEVQSLGVKNQML